MKDAMTSVDLRALAMELALFRDARVQKCYHVPPDEVRLGFYSATAGRLELLIEAGRRAHLTSEPRQAPKNPSGFAMTLRKSLSGARLLDVQQHDFDRILRIDAARSEGSASLIIELFAHGNVIVLDENSQIMAALRTLRMRDRDVARGETYVPPPAQLSPVDADEGQLAEVLSSSKTDLVRTLATRFNMGGLYAEEVCMRAGIDKNSRASELVQGDISHLHDAMKETFTPLLGGGLRPQVIFEDGKPVDAVALDLLVYRDREKREYATFSEALEAYYSAVLEDAESPVSVSGPSGTANGTAVDDGRKVDDTSKRRLARQEQITAEYNVKRKELVAAAEAIYSLYQDVEATLELIRGARQEEVSWDSMVEHLKDKTTVPVLEIMPAKGAVVLELDGRRVVIVISDTVPQAAQRLYDEAKELANKVDGAKRAIEDTKKIIAENAAPPKKREAILQPAKRRWYHRFRWFRSGDGILVVGGFDADTNEELVKRYMEKRDVFMHAQARGAPVVIIKTDGQEVPPETLQQAAQLAVSCSSVWESGVLTDDAYWVKPEQVSKTPESGEYITKGSFVVRGERNTIKNVPVRLAVGLLTADGLELVAAPPTAMGGAECWVELAPGGFARRDAAKKTYRQLVELVRPELKKTVNKFMKQDMVEHLLPRGGSDIVADSGDAGEHGAA